MSRQVRAPRPIEDGGEAPRRLRAGHEVQAPAHAPSRRLWARCQTRTGGDTIASDAVRGPPPVTSPAMTPGDYLEWAGRQFDPAAVFGKPEALRGVRVIDLGTIFLGPTTTSYLAEYGAEVIKVEIPGAGDTIRALGPSFHQNMSLIGLNEPKNKYFVGLDVRKPRGADIFRRLAARADVLVENFRAGTLDRWPIGYRQPREGNPRRLYPAHNALGQAGAD